MKPKTYAILSRAVIDGLAHAWRTAFKHTDNPPSEKHRETWEDAAYMEVMAAICEVFDFEDKQS